MTTDGALDDLATRPVGAGLGRDAGPGGRARIGLVALATDLTSEHEFPAMLPADGVATYVSRIAYANPMTLESLGAMAGDLTRAAALILPDSRLDVIAYGCTSGTVAMGPETVGARIQAARPGIPWTTPVTAAIEGLRRLGVGRVAVLTPYPDEVNQAIRAFLEGHGVAVVALSSFFIESDADVALVPPAAIVAAGREADRAEAEALFISCTALRAAAAIAPLEETLGKPVLTSNQALAWRAQRLAGCTDHVPGYGRLMEL